MHLGPRDRPHWHAPDRRDVQVEARHGAFSDCQITKRRQRIVYSASCPSWRRNCLPLIADWGCLWPVSCTSRGRHSPDPPVSWRAKNRSKVSLVRSKFGSRKASPGLRCKRGDSAIELSASETSFVSSFQQTLLLAATRGRSGPQHPQRRQPANSKSAATATAISLRLDAIPCWRRRQTVSGSSARVMKRPWNQRKEINSFSSNGSLPCLIIVIIGKAFIAILA